LINNLIDIDLEEIYLYPSSLVVHEQPRRVHTILGSCVAVCLYDKMKRIGGINHYMLPYWRGSGLASPKFGNIAIEKLIAGMMAAGCKKEHLVAKIFGGATMLEVNAHTFNIGEKNIMAAMDILKNYTIPIVAQSVGGKKGRKIIFNTKTGEVAHRFINAEDISYG
jgi:chemotaxis protein CheD